MRRLIIALLVTVATIGGFASLSLASPGPATTVYTEVEAP